MTHPNETNRASKRRETMLALVPDGGVTVGAVARALGILQASAEARLRLYAKAGHLFMARVARGDSKHSEGWYFRDEAARDAVQAECTKKYQPKRAPKWVRGGTVKATRVEATNPNDVKPVEYAHTLRHRHTADEVPPLFSSLRPGQYIAPAPAWLQGVAM